MERGDLRDVCCECCDAGSDGFDPGEEVFLREDVGTGRAIVGQPVVGAGVIGAAGVVRELVVHRHGGLQVLDWLEVVSILEASRGTNQSEYLNGPHLLLHPARPASPRTAQVHVKFVHMDCHRIVRSARQTC